MSILKEDDNKLISKFEFIKENTLKRLDNILISESDSEVKKTILETIEKVKNETFNKVSYVKLKNLNESL
jgi:hypothetical protein